MNSFALSAGGVWESIVKWYQQSLLCELLNHFEEKYFSVNFKSYENFSISNSKGASITSAILAIAVGIIIASAIMAHTKSCHGAFVRKLLKNGATSPENAKTLSELGFFHNLSIRRELKKGVSLRKLVVCKEKEEAEKASSFTDETAEQEEPIDAEPCVTLESTEEKKQSKVMQILLAIKYFFIPKKDSRDVFEIDFATMHFYIPEDLRYRADVRYEKKGSGWLPFIVVSIATVVATALLCVYLPELFQFADNLISFLSPK